MWSNLMLKASVKLGLQLMQIGLVAGWSSPYIAQLLSGESIILITKQEATIIVSLVNVGRIIGGILGAVFVAYFGSRKTILFSSVPISLCWIFKIIANNIVWLYLGRFLGGFYLGVCYTCFSLYLGEIADSNIRGALVLVGMIGMSCGYLLMSIMGPYLSLILSSSVCLILSTIYMLLFIWLPDTPHHLMIQKRFDKVKKSILWYHRNSNVNVEFLNLKQFIESSCSESIWQTLQKFKIPQMRKALIITNVLFFYTQSCGINNIAFYMEIILENAEVTVIKPSLVVIIIAICGIFGCLLSIRLIDYYGRKFLMCVSCFAIAISLTVLGIHFELLESDIDPNKIQWIPIASFILFQIAVFAGLLPVPSAIVGEIFPPDIKCVAASICSINAAIFAFISSSTYQFFIDLMTEKFTYWMYAILLITAIPTTIIFLPETKGKTLQEIQDQLMSKGSKEYKKMMPKVQRPCAGPTSPEAHTRRTSNRIRAICEQTKLISPTV
ncbi:PREDICTED: facilitated trehalose transporter Tret1-like [Polistes dominula]|uniref:Facilitated trehalose transporter Tret1-like n=1 Tax=Polistes dominula TaxID=743375 RepID=A0ABM1IBD5_POLDO|nr:PREDICTED: facilitated trehalose transporter Tret1-like [Polistes dominula]